MITDLDNFVNRHKRMINDVRHLDAQDMHLRSQRCLSLAGKSVNIRYVQSMLELADMWLRLAIQYENNLGQRQELICQAEETAQDIMRLTHPKNW